MNKLSRGKKNVEFVTSHKPNDIIKIGDLISSKNTHSRFQVLANNFVKRFTKIGAVLCRWTQKVFVVHRRTDRQTSTAFCENRCLQILTIVESEFDIISDLNFCNHTTPYSKNRHGRSVFVHSCSERMLSYLSSSHFFVLNFVGISQEYQL